MDYTPNPHAFDLPPPTPSQPSWTGPQADARTEDALATLHLMIEKATELAVAAQAVALAQLAEAARAPPAPVRQDRQPSSRHAAVQAPRHGGLPAFPAVPASDPAHTFARLFHLITRAIVEEHRIADMRRTQDQRDRLADHRAAGPAEQTRRGSTKQWVSTLVGDAIAAAPDQRSAPAWRKALNRRLADSDIAARLVHHQAADIAAALCADLDIPLAAPATRNGDPDDEPDPAGQDMDALLRSILNHPSLDRPSPPSRPP